MGFFSSKYSFHCFSKLCKFKVTIYSSKELYILNYELQSLFCPLLASFIWMPPHSGSSIDRTTELCFHPSSPFITAFSAVRDKTTSLLEVLIWIDFSCKHTHQFFQSTPLNSWGMNLLQKKYADSHLAPFLSFTSLILVFKKAVIALLDRDVRLYCIYLKTSAFYPEANKQTKTPWSASHYPS